MLLVLLPTVGPGATQETQLTRATNNRLLNSLQLQLGTTVRVLRVDAVTHPAVVHAFDGWGVVPAFVLLRDGEEVYRQQGLPEGEPLAALLLSKLAEFGN